MEVYLKVFINYKQNDWAKIFLIDEFAYNNTKNVSTYHTSFELNYGYDSRVFYKKNINSWSKSKSANKLLTKLRKLMTVYRKNLYHAQELQKQAHNKIVKPRSYTLSN